MKKATRIVSIFVISMLCFQELIHVSSSPFLYAHQVYEESSGGRNLKQEQEQEQKHAQEVHCSRERSRAARKVIEEYLTPFMERENYQLSSKCKLHPENDIFTDQEEHKIYIDRHEWRCGYCKKSFREEKFLDQHFDSRHYNFLNLSHGKCLGDLCGALHCDAVMNFKSSRSKCNPAAAARNRHLCENLADNCFPISEGPSAGRLHELFLHQFCDAHTCSGKHKPFSRGGKDQSSFFRLAAGALILVLLPVFYLFLYLVQSDVKSRTQELRRISKAGWKSKPS
ncbi:hypothetical protein AAZX31_13G070100 [Glycine max]|uniref:C2H2-type domain-containing protein n=2 Tax=Glycine subgen. Soja TaxID=1462606 RepID=I1LW13_SOYBN|nr:uncharacterized protein LOC100780668 isoform X2 [Glycine max]XP_028195828.1 uncharacterized protein LOC114380909 isoform X2 [Glycine soja]KAG4383435.1 hypothetical protein GLYMA_13G086300v4 [Glycine max]KAG4383436.1 hypothetical protein GLYMA_13G086300v4 [Glycine max]KAG4383437.1 hypothetical protein GLYMA_13G086300v4 [Glycine max]KAG4976355.1 hypothetical protein JHK86_035829 [Glycine max]KAG5129703.1 hypothetical protein JHK84_036100 [Glycine max]|eukprot:XP_006593576.1 uncharacterized protein LOC100780668 isoform X2 [Glycine max]